MPAWLWFVVVCTACYYLVARANITRGLWGPLSERKKVLTTPGRTGTLRARDLATILLVSALECPACSGWWLGLALAHVVPPFDHPPGGCAGLELKAGLLAMVGVSIVFGAMKWGLDRAAVND